MKMLLRLVAALVGVLIVIGFVYGLFDSGLFN